MRKLKHQCMIMYDKLNFIKFRVQVDFINGKETFWFCLYLQESCQCTNVLAAAVPDQFYFQANSLVTPLLKSLSHQHSKVRVSCIQVRKYYCVGNVTQFSILWSFSVVTFSSLGH